MPTPTSQRAAKMAHLAERRWQRVRAISARSCAQRSSPASSTVVKENSRLDFFRRHRVALGATLVPAALVIAAAASLWRGPSPEQIQAGQTLFAHKWQPDDPLSAAGDGLGPVFNARSCGECHFQGGLGGGGGLQQNVAAFEVMPTVGRPDPTGGVIHAFATQADWSESPQTVRKVFPIIREGVTITAVCQAPLRKDYDPVRQHSINTPTLFGSGQVDRISGIAIRARHARQILSSAKRELQFEFDGPSVGRVRVLPDGRVGKFGWKAQFATLEEFVANACAVEVGLSTPTRKQHRPQAHCEDETAPPDLDHRQFRQLVAFVSELPAPRLMLPETGSERALALQGQQIFSQIGCAHCHTPELGGATGVYSDFCLHDITEPRTGLYSETVEVPVPDAYPKAAEWKTPPLWGVAQTAPYLHDGSATTLEQAIEAHAGQARATRENFRKLPPGQRQALILFLESLRNPDQPEPR